MEHEVRVEENAVVIVLRGDLDLATSRDVRQVLLNAVAQKKAVVVDLAGVAYMDSSGVASLVEALQAAKTSDRPLILAAVTPAVLRVLQLARLDRVFTIEASVDAALASQG